MSGLESVISLEYDKCRYTIVILTHLGNEIPILLDRSIYKIIKKYGYRWYINDKDHVYTVRSYIHGGDTYEEYLYIHDLVMRLGRAGIAQKEVKSHDIAKYTEHALIKTKLELTYPIIHINKVHFDNRYSNLQYDSPDKDHAKNTKKKKRTINLKKYGISAQELPTYVWYIKPDKTHGSRFSVEIPDEISWRSTSSKNLSLRYKLEEVKKYIRHLRRRRSDIFDHFCMNGDLSLKGKTLLREYNKMIEHANYTIPIPINSNTDLFIQKDLTGLSSEEIYILYSFDPVKGAVNVNRKLNEYRLSMA
jgi:hypothetical protein